MDAAAIKKLLHSNDILVIKEGIEQVAKAEITTGENRRQQEQLVKLQIMLWSRVLHLQQNDSAALEDDSVLTYNAIGQLWMRMGDSEKAVGQFQKALLVCDKHVSSLELLSQAYTNLREYDRAVSHQEAAIEIIEKREEANGSMNALVMAYTQLASIYEAKGDFAQAVSILKKDIDRVEHSTVQEDVAVEVYSRLGVLQTKLGESKDAAVHLQKAHAYYHRVNGENHAKTQEMAFLLELTDG